MSARQVMSHAHTDTRSASAVAKPDGRSGPFPVYRVDVFTTDAGGGTSGVFADGYAFIVKDTTYPRYSEWVVSYDHTEARSFYPTLGSAVTAVAQTAARLLVPPA